jgi:nucleotide-binding universal stress UspA family protein
MVSTILAVLTEPSTSRAVLDAAAVAADHDTTIEILHVRVDPRSLILPTEEVMTKTRREELESMLSERSRLVQRAFHEWSVASAELAGRARWQEITGTVEAEVTARGKSAGLLVLARPVDGEGDDALHAAIFAVRRLFLLVPPDGAGDFGHHMAIAWKASETAERTVLAAMPWLKRAQRISILMAGQGAASPEPLLAILAQHGVASVTVAVKTIAGMAGEDDIGAALLATARSLSADSLVTGAYRRHRFFEWVLGGVTRHVLHHSDLPAFMLH